MARIQSTNTVAGVAIQCKRERPLAVLPAPPKFKSRCYQHRDFGGGTPTAGSSTTPFIT